MKRERGLGFSVLQGFWQEGISRRPTGEDHPLNTLRPSLSSFWLSTWAFMVALHKPGQSEAEAQTCHNRTLWFPSPIWTSSFENPLKLSRLTYSSTPFPFQLLLQSPRCQLLFTMHNQMSHISQRTRSTSETMTCNDHIKWKRGNPPKFGVPGQLISREARAQVLTWAEEPTRSSRNGWKTAPLWQSQDLGPLAPCEAPPKVHARFPWGQQTRLQAARSPRS